MEFDCCLCSSLLSQAPLYLMLTQKVTGITKYFPAICGNSCIVVVCLYRQYVDLTQGEKQVAISDDSDSEELPAISFDSTRLVDTKRGCVCVCMCVCMHVHMWVMSLL